MLHEGGMGHNIHNSKFNCKSATTQYTPKRLSPIKINTCIHQKWYGPIHYHRSLYLSHVLYLENKRSFKL